MYLLLGKTDVLNGKPYYTLFPSSRSVSFNCSGHREKIVTNNKCNMQFNLT